MFEFDISDILRKKLKKLAKKDKILVQNFKRKLQEVIHCNEKTISTYKNLKSPLNQFKRIHLTDNFILLFKVYEKDNKVVFFDIIHRNRAYKNK